MERWIERWTEIWMERGTQIWMKRLIERLMVKWT